MTRTVAWMMRMVEVRAETVPITTMVEASLLSALRAPWMARSPVMMETTHCGLCSV